MAELTIDQLKGIAPNITDEEATGIAALASKGDKALIDKSRGEAWRAVDEAAAAASGVPRNEGEKTTDYIARLNANYKQFETDKTSIASKVKDLEKQISEGKGDDGLRQKLKDNEALLEQMKQANETLKTEMANKLKQAESDSVEILTELDFAGATNGFVAKETYTTEDVKILVDAKKQSILGKYKREVVNDNGKKAVIYRDEKGEVVRDDQFNPATGAYLLSKEISIFAKESRKVEGLGSKSPQGQAGSTQSLRIQATTRVKAMEEIEAFVIGQGIDRKKPEFQQQVDKLYKETKAFELPLQ